MIDAPDPLTTLIEHQLAVRDPGATTLAPLALACAREDLRAAEAALRRRDPNTALVAAVDAAYRSCAAYLTSQGLRITQGAHRHGDVLRAVMGALADRVPPAAAREATDWQAALESKDGRQVSADDALRAFRAARDVHTAVAAVLSPG